jgi:riboflavin kinase / FMN adenylyltransferase
VNAQRVDGAARLRAAPGSTLVTIGNFDGVHRGHRSVLERGLEEARARQLSPVVLTFHPHPSEVLGQGVRPVLTPLERKVELLGRLSPELRIVVEPFTTELAQRTPREFAQGLLAHELGAKLVVVGENFKFGRGRAGSSEALAELGRELGFEARAEPLMLHDTGVISSTRIRDLLSTGAAEQAEALLGRPHALTGRVIVGEGVARKLGVPSANLGEIPELLPARGVYAVLVDALEDERFRALGLGVANIGVRPTLGQGELRVEVHVLDLDRDLYGMTLRAHVVERLRDEQRFPDIVALKAQLARDVEAARAALRERRPDPAAGGAWH